VKRHIKGPCLTRSWPIPRYALPALPSIYTRGTLRGKPIDLFTEELKHAMDEAMAIAPPRMMFWSKLQDPDKW
jgi:hypothetical protein